jgi:hypothetical protein
MSTVQGVIPAIDATTSRTFSRISSATAPINAGLRTCQSTLRRCAQRTTPLTGNPDGSATSVLYPFTRLVIGQTKARLERRLNCLDDRTRAGLRPACSWPACGLKSSQIRSPASGILELTTPQTRVEVPNQSLPSERPLEDLPGAPPASFASDEHQARNPTSSPTRFRRFRWEPIQLARRPAMRPAQQVLRESPPLGYSRRA